MLPDFPELKQKLHDLLYLGAKIEVTSKDPLLNEIEPSILHEGNHPIIERVDGSVHDTGLSTFKGILELKTEEIENISLKDLFQKFCDTYMQIAKQQKKMFFDEIAEVTENVGNVINMKGRIFQIED